MSRNILVLSCVLTACHDSGFARVGDVGADIQPEIEVTPSTLDFGELASDDSRTMMFTVRNVGPKGSVLAVNDITASGIEGGDFVLGDDDVDFGLGGGDKRTFTVTFAPDEPTRNLGEVIVKSNDDRDPSLPVDLVGYGLMPRLRIDPNPYDYGTVNVGCPVDQTFRLTNVGTETLTLSDLSGLGSGFQAIEVPYMPLMLDPAESTEMLVRFNPSDDVAYDGNFAVDSNDPHGTQTAEYQGIGHVPTEVRDTWDLLKDPPVDILFFVDQSDSMRDDQDALSDNFGAFIDNIERITSDWHVAVVTRDGGCASALLTPDTPNYVTAFTTAVRDGNDSRYSEQGFTLTWEALNQTEGSECNSGFLRDGSILHVIMVSDEPEQSATPWTAYVDDLHTLRGDPGTVKVSAIAGDLPIGCSTPNNSAAAGIGYYEASQATMGVFLSLCSSWSNEFDTLASASTERAVFPLSSSPDIDTIVVTVNSREKQDIWVYDEARNAVVFTASYPGSGDSVVIDYHEPNVCR